MPRLTEARRAARKSEIVAAARRCFARDGFHQTSMGDIAAEAGLSVGAAYRHFAGKEELVLEIAGQAFGALFGAAGVVVESTTPADYAVAATERFAAGAVRHIDGEDVPIDELIRCGVQSWAELIRHDDMKAVALAAFDRKRHRIAAGIAEAQAAKLVRADLDPEQAARVLMALLHGYVLQCVAFGLTDTAGFTQAVRQLLTPA